MFGPANAGGPPQANTNPGSRAPQGNAQLPPPGSPPPTDPEATGSIQPQGVRPLPQGTPIEPNTVIAPTPKKGLTAQPGYPQEGPIELLPGDADPNLLPPEIRDSWMFRYQQAQRAAQYKQAEEEAKWANVVGGVGNIAQIISGQRPTYQQGTARAKEPGAMDIGTLYGWKKDYDTAAKEAQATADYRALVERIKRDNPKATASDIEAIALDKNKLAQYGFNRVDQEQLAKVATQQLDAVKKSQEIVPASLQSPETLAAIHKQFPALSIETLKSLPPQTLSDLVKQATTAQEQSQGGERVKIAGAEIKDANDTNAKYSSLLARNAMARQSLESGAGIGGGGFTATETEAKVRDIASRFGGINTQQQINDAAVTALTAQAAIDMSQGMKGSLSDKDVALLRQAAGGDPNMTNEQRSRVLALNDLMIRRAIDENNDKLVRAGQRINEDRSGETKKVGALSNAELREIDPRLLALSAANPELAEQELALRYGKTTAKEIIARRDDVIESRLYTQPAKPEGTWYNPQTNVTHGRTVLDNDANTLLRSYSADEIVARREQIITKLDQLDPGNGAANYELLLAAKRGGGFGPKGAKP